MNLSVYGSRLPWPLVASPEGNIGLRPLRSWVLLGASWGVVVRAAWGTAGGADMGPRHWRPPTKATLSESQASGRRCWMHSLALPARARIDPDQGFNFRDGCRGHLRSTSHLVHAAEAIISRLFFCLQPAVLFLRYSLDCPRCCQYPAATAGGVKYAFSSSQSYSQCCHGGVVSQATSPEPPEQSGLPPVRSGLEKTRNNSYQTGLVLLYCTVHAYKRSS